MYSKNNAENSLVLFLLIVALLSFSSLLVVLDQKTPTANIVARAGEISNISIFQTASTSMWSVLYGSFDEITGISSFDLSSSQIININFTSYGYDSSMVIIANKSEINLSDIVQVPLNVVDAYLGVGSSHPESGTNTFNKLYNISIGNITQELYGTKTLSYNGSFITAAFLSNGNLAFVTTTANGSSFDNTSTFFQFMLPINAVENYSFEVVSNITCPSSFQITGIVDLDNTSVRLNWTPVPGALKYSIFYTDGVNISNHIEFSQINSTNITGTIFLDVPVSNTRFYEVEAILPVYSCRSSNTVGMYRLNLSPSLNLLSFPFKFVNSSVEEVLRPIWSSFSSLSEYDNVAQKYYFSILFMGEFSQNFDDVSVGKGYWLVINETVNLTVVGTIEENLFEPVFNRLNLIGFPFIFGNNSVAHSLRSIDGNYSSVSEYDNDNNLYYFYSIFGGSVSNNFNTIKPLSGYWININETETITLP